MASASVSVAARSGSCSLPVTGEPCPPFGSCFLCPHYSATPAALDARAHERARLHDTLDAAGRRGLTQRELVERAHLSPAAVHERLAELVAEGVVSRRRRKRRTPAGGYAAVYVLTWGGP